MQQTSTFLRDSVSSTLQTTLQTLSLSVLTLCSHPEFPSNSGACLICHNGPTLPPTPDRRPNWRHYQQNFYVCWHRLSQILLLCLPWKILEQLFFTGSPILPDVPIQFFNGIWACTPFPHTGSVLCLCPYKERIVCQTTIARTPSHWSADDPGCGSLITWRWGGNCDIGQPHIPTLMLSVTAGCSFMSYPGPEE